MKKLLLLLLIIPTLAWANGFDRLKADLAPQGIILLDVFDAPIKHTQINGRNFSAFNIVFGLDKGYGYSIGPFTGTIYLLEQKSDHIQWELVGGDDGSIQIKHFDNKEAAEDAERKAYYEILRERGDD
jgi:hypothetical protein